MKLQIEAVFGALFGSTLVRSPQIVCSHRPGATLMITCYRVVILHRALMTSLASRDDQEERDRPGLHIHIHLHLRTIEWNRSGSGLYGLDHGSRH